MKFEDYQSQVLRHRSDAYSHVKPDLAHGIIGLVTEAGELADLLKKLHFHPHKHVGREKIIDELGDIMWYYSLTLRSIGATLSEVLEANAAKLRVRYEVNGGMKDKEAEAQAQANANVV